MRVTEFRRRRLRELHVRTSSEDGARYLYPPRPGREVEAKEAWPHTGVCPSCHLRAISVGRCLQCGWEPRGAR